MSVFLKLRNKIVVFTLVCLGRLLERRGANQASIWCFTEAWKLSPNIENLGLDLFESARSSWQSQDYVSARRMLDVLLEWQPLDARSLNLLGVIELIDENYSEAIRCCKKAIDVQHDWAAPHNNLGNALLAIDDFSGAERSFRLALEYDSGYAEAWCNLATLLNRSGKYDEAEHAAQTALKLRPNFPGAMNNLGSILLNKGMFVEGLAQYRAAVALQPDLIEAQINLAVSADEPGRLAGLMGYFQSALERNDKSYSALLRLGQISLSMGEVDDAEEYICRLIRIMPSAFDAYILLSAILSRQGLNQRLVETERIASALGVSYALSFASVFHAIYSDDSDSGFLYRLSREHVERYIEKDGYSVPKIGIDLDLSVGKLLRVGYVSRDFCNHSVAYFLEPIIENHNRDCFFVICYANLPKGDSVTEKFRGMACLWRDIYSVNDSDFERMLKEDGVDILIDLTGYTTGGRQGVFSRKPSPIQVSYLGCPMTSGMLAMDYRLVDAFTDPPGVADQHHTETLWRLPLGFLTYKPPEAAPDIVQPPFFKNGYITFGSFNVALKITERVVAIWSKILNSVPCSRLVLKSLTFASQHGKEYFQSIFEAYGLGADRVELVSWIPDSKGHMGLYGRIDIALDPFPYNGTTTTCEALWMGLPVIVLAGDRHSARVGVSLLNQLGLTELIADSVEEYIDLAVKLAHSPDRIQTYRQGMRSRMENSSLLDHVGFTRRLEDAYQEMWRIVVRRSKMESSQGMVKVVPVGQLEEPVSTNIH